MTTKKILALAISLLVSTPSWAQSFRPFSTNLSIPGHLTSSMNQFQVDGGLLFEPQTIRLAEFDVSMHPLIANLMIHISNTQGVQGLPQFENCEMINAINAFQNQGDGRVVDVMNRVRSICAKIMSPEAMYATNKLFDPGTLGLLTAMTSIEEILRTIMTPLLMQGTAFSWFDVETTQKIRMALFRIRYSDLKKELNQLQKTLDSVAGSLSGADQATARELRNLANQQMARIMVINNDGINAYKADARVLAAKGKNRAALPYQNLSDDDRRYLSMYTFALMWRFRGGGMVDKPKGTQESRLYFAQRPYDVLASINGAEGASGLGADQLIRLVSKGWGKFFDMGHTVGEEPLINDLINMTSRGIYQVEGTMETLSRAGYDVRMVKAMGLHFGTCYLYSWEKLENVRVKDGLQPPFQGFFDSPTAWGEMCVGAALGLGLSETLLQGR